MIVSRYLSEPDSALARGHSLITPLPEFGSESFLSKVWRAVRRAVPLRLPSLGAARQPFQRLDFWTASHPLSFKLRLYQVSEPKVDMWRGFTWETLRYWNDLMSGEEPEPDLTVQIVRRWYEDLTSDDPERRAYALEEAGVAHAEPFAD